MELRYISFRVGTEALAALIQDGTSFWSGVSSLAVSPCCIQGRGQCYSPKVKAECVEHTDEGSTSGNDEVQLIPAMGYSVFP